MPRPNPRPYQLTAALVASSVGTGVMCLSAEGLGRTYRLHATRPGPALNRRITRPSADLPSGAAHVVSPVTPPAPALIRVDISGPLEQRAGYHDPCSGWTDGHDAVAERLCAAFEQGDVLLVVDGPGGAAAGLQQAVTKALAAKAKHGRRCTGFVNEMCASAHVWWTFAVCDEVFLPLAGMIGSIGARGGHTSIAGMLARDGVAVTYFADPPDKVALAPEFPLSEVGAARGNRDVKICADAFRAAVCASPIGLRSKLTPEALIALGADMLTGWNAVNAGLADGVATEDEVTVYALRMAETKAEKTSSSAQARAPRGETMSTVQTDPARARAADPPDPDDDAPAAGAEIPTACASCGVENPVAAKFCMGCGGSMATQPIEASDDEEPPPSSKPMPAASAARMAPTASLADVLGLSADASLPAQKAAALDLRQVFDLASKLTGHSTAPGIVSGLSAIAHDASQASRLRAERNTERAKAETAERNDLCKRLVASGGEERGRVFVDSVSPEGKRTGVSIAPMFAEMRMPTLRQLVSDHEKRAKPRDPFEPDRAAAEASARDVARTGGVDEKTRLERAKKSPAVLRMFNAPGNTHSLDAIAAQYLKTLDAQPALPGGAS